MGLTERHWFEDEEPELTERQLEDIVSMQDIAYKRGYNKGYSDRNKEIVRCKDCEHGEPGDCGYGVDCDGVWHYDDWFCADGTYKETTSCNKDINV